MKSILCVILSVGMLVSSTVQATVVVPCDFTDVVNPDMELVMQAIVYKESHGNDTPTKGDHGTANGPFQIRQGCIIDTLGKKHTAAECHGNRELSRKVFLLYMKRFASESQLGHAPTLRDCARVWNGGPSGTDKVSTEGYADDVVGYYLKLAAGKKLPLSKGCYLGAKP